MPSSFARLSKAQREAAYQALRARVGPSHRISLDELESAYENMPLVKRGGFRPFSLLPSERR